MAESDLSKVKKSFFNYSSLPKETDEEKKARLEKEAEEKARKEAEEKARKEQEEREADERVARGEGSLAETVTSNLRKLQKKGFPPYKKEDK